MEQYNQIILKAIQYIEDHMEEKITLDDIAYEVNVSKFHFLRIFEMSTGKSVGEYLFQRRMTNAADFLMKNKREVLSIAIRSGYSSQEAFTRAFRDYFKITPGQFDSLRTDRRNMFCYPLTENDLKFNQGKVSLEYELNSMEQFTLCGFAYSGTNKKKELSILVNEFLHYMFQQDHSIIEQIPWMMGYSSCRLDSKATKETYYYLIGVKEHECIEKIVVENERWKKLMVPTNVYARFRLSSNIDRLHTEISQAYQSLLQNGRYLPTGSYVLEKYDSTFIPNDKDAYTEFYIPVIEVNNDMK